jgi:hypothetical protein
MATRSGSTNAGEHAPSQPSQPSWRVDTPVEDDPVQQVLARRVPWVVHHGTFSQQSFGTGPWPEQGWKLHVSATPDSAVPVLEAALDVLLAHGARFKVVQTLGLLAAMNGGVFGNSQIGKFLTVYPSDDDQAVRLAVDLDVATRGHRGPRVPTDRVLRPGSLVHYRYGAMVRRPESMDDGEPTGFHDLLDPAGRLSDDVRLEYYQAPDPAIVDPFEAAGVRIAPPGRARFLDGRFFVTDALAQSARGGVFRAVDVSVDPARVCLLKESWHDVGLDPFGRDARDWARNEERILTRHADEPSLPRCYGSFEIDGDRYLAIEFVAGRSLDKVLAEEHGLDEGLEPDEVVEIGLATADALARLHDLGLVFRDFKPANLIRTPDGGYRLIDFGIAHEYRTDTSEPLSIGTPPFYAREQYAGEQPHPLDDVFAWGAVLFHLAGGEGSFADMPKGRDLQQPFPRRPLLEHRPGFPPALAAVIDRAVAWERADRWPTMGAARDALAAAAATLVDPSQAWPADASPGPRSVVHHEPDPALDAEAALRLAREVGDALLEAAEERDGGLTWRRRYEFADRTEHGPDIYGGTAGVALYLAELAGRTGDERYADAARGAARWLAGPAWGRGRAQHGLHHGEGGVAWTFLRLAERLDAPGYVAAADLRMRRLRGAAATTTDLIYGTAGTVLALLAVHDATGDDAHLAEARALGDDLVAAAIPGPGGLGCFWEVAAATPGGPIQPLLGLMHGAAGIALALAHLGERTGDARHLDTALGAAELLLAAGRPEPTSTITDEGGRAGGEAVGVTWPRFLGDPPVGLQAHCHGAGGIGQFFLWLDRIAPDPRYRAVAAAAARAVADTRALDDRSGICHGLSGTGHLMLDCHQAFGGSRWRDLADECAGHLARFRVADRPGVYAMRGDASSPDLLVGFAGVGSFLLRLADAESAPDLVMGPLTTSLRKAAHHVRRDPQPLHAAPRLR